MLIYARLLKLGIVLWSGIAKAFGSKSKKNVKRKNKSRDCKVNLSIQVREKSMVRITNLLFNRAVKDSRLLDLLLPACKTLESSRAELNWIQNELPQSQWLEACTKRSELVPLQYILGSQPFGDLDIKCRDNVLIPRWETEEWTLKLIKQVQTKSNLKILDICTGTGCIPLLIAHNLKDATVKGLDVSDHALALANENKIATGVPNVEFEKGNVFDSDVTKGDLFDLVTSNPPYISEVDFESQETEESVRLYEPKLALVGGVEFYKALIENVVFPSKAKGFIFELGDLEQAKYTQSLLGEDWKSKIYKDSNDKIRCVYGWKLDSNMQTLSNINDGVYESLA